MAWHHRINRLVIHSLCSNIIILSCLGRLRFLLLMLRSKLDEQFSTRIPNIPPSDSEIQVIRRRIISQPVLKHCCCMLNLHAISSRHAPEDGSSALRSIRNNRGHCVIALPQPALCSNLANGRLRAFTIDSAPSASPMDSSCFKP